MQNQSTSSILLALSGAEACVSFSRFGSSSSMRSSSIDRPSLIIRWILVAKEEGSSSEKPEASRAVSKSSQTRSRTVLSLLSWSAFFLSSTMMAWSGLISIVFLETM